MKRNTRTLCRWFAYVTEYVLKFQVLKDNNDITREKATVEIMKTDKKEAINLTSLNRENNTSHASNKNIKMSEFGSPSNRTSGNNNKYI